MKFGSVQCLCGTGEQDDVKEGSDGLLCLC